MNTTAAAPAFTLTPVGAPHTAHEWDGVTSRTVTRQAYDVVSDTPVLVTAYGAPNRVARVRVNVANPADIDVEILRQRARGGDYAKRVGSFESAARIREFDHFAELRPILDAVEALLNPPAPTAQDTVDAAAERLRIAIQERDHEDTIAGLRDELRDARNAAAVEAVELPELDGTGMPLSNPAAATLAQSFVLTFTVDADRWAEAADEPVAEAEADFRRYLQRGAELAEYLRAGLGMLAEADGQVTVSPK